MNIRICVRSGTTTRDFVAQVHRSSLPSEFYLDSVDFYAKWGKAIPHGEHFELEIIEPQSSFFLENKLHTHRSIRTKNPMVFYPWHIATIERAQAIFRVWSIGSVGKIDRGLDLNAVYSVECEGSEMKYLQFMREKYDVSVFDEKLEVE